jgi:hypothetical protein
MTRIVNSLDDLAFMLQDMPASIKTMKPQDILHALDYRLSKRERIMPKGATQADFWMLTHGDPLTSTDAALALAGQIGTIDDIEIAGKPGDYTAVIHYDGSPHGGAGETIPHAIIIAAVNYKHFYHLNT